MGKAPKVSQLKKGIELYEEAANIIRQANAKRASVKTLIYSSNYKNVKQLFAVVHECRKYQQVLKEILERCPSTLFEGELSAGGNEELALVMLHEFLLGIQFGRNQDLRRIFMCYQGEIQKAVDEAFTHLGVNSFEEALHAKSGSKSLELPRYLRVNLIKSSVEEVVKALKKEGWIFTGRLQGENFADAVSKLGESDFGTDPFLFDVLIFPHGTDFHDHKLVKDGTLIQQDRASCIPAHVLSPSKGAVVLDCCAAPGNKTTHLASLMKNKGRVFGVDKDPKRMQTMSHLVDRSGASCIHLINQDFLTVHPQSEDAKEIEMILVDPSCSGSGMRCTQPNNDEPPDPPERLQALKQFQITILKHALSFPSVEKVVYSTCSIHREENEEVIADVLAEVNLDFELEKVLEHWTGGSRGLPDFENSDCFLRLSPEVDLTQGFFVACFRRIQNLDSVESTVGAKKKKKKKNKKKES